MRLQKWYPLLSVQKLFKVCKSTKSVPSVTGTKFAPWYKGTQILNLCESTKLYPCSSKEIVYRVQQGYKSVS